MENKSIQIQEKEQKQRERTFNGLTAREWTKVSRNVWSNESFLREFGSLFTPSFSKNLILAYLTIIYSRKRKNVALLNFEGDVNYLEKKFQRCFYMNKKFYHESRKTVSLAILASGKKTLDLDADYFIAQDSKIEELTKQLRLIYDRLENKGYVCVLTFPNYSGERLDLPHIQISTLVKEIGYKYHDLIFWTTESMKAKAEESSERCKKIPVYILILRKLEQNNSTTVKPQTVLHREGNNTSSKIELSKFNFDNKKLNTTYLTHNFHSYPAKFIPQIPCLAIEMFTKKGETVFDPFCGAGTTLVEAKLLGRNAIGVDINHIAVLLSEVKTTKLVAEEFKLVENFISELKHTVLEFNEKPDYKDKYHFTNKNHWFQDNVQTEIVMIKQIIGVVQNKRVRRFLNCALSSIMTQISNQESDTRYAAKDKQIKDFTTLKLFTNKVKAMQQRLKEFTKIATDSKIEVFTEDSRRLNFLQDNCVDFLVTSPPYANTYDYYLYHKHRMHWLGFDVKKVKENEIGSRNQYSSKKEKPDTFYNDLAQCFQQFSRILKPKKYALLVIGDSVIQGKLIKINKEVERITIGSQFKYITDFSYNLKQNTRAFNPSFTNAEKEEHIIVLQNTK